MVSIGIPTYNQGRYIGKAIESIINQSFEEIEIIISNNSSNDNTDNICREYAAKDRRINYYLQDKNIGPIRNFDFVLSKATGDYFFWAASDDFFSNNWIEMLLPNFGADTILSVGKIVNIAEDNKVIREWDTKDYLDTNRVIRSLKYYLSNSMEGNYVHGIFRTEYLRMAGGMKRYGWAWPITDRMLIYHVIQDGKIKTSNKAILYKRIERSSAIKFPKSVLKPLISLLTSNYLSLVKVPLTIKFLSLILMLPKISLLIIINYKKVLQSMIEHR